MAVQEILKLEEENRSLIKTYNRMRAYSSRDLYEDEDINRLLNLLLANDKVFVSSTLPFDLSQMNTNDLIDFIMNSYLAAETCPIVIPINMLSKQKTSNTQQAYSGMHWVVAIIYPQTGNYPAKITIFDPFGNGCEKDINLTYKGKHHQHPATAKLLGLGAFLKDALNSFGVKIDDSNVCIYKDVIQKNSVDCGPIVVESTKRMLGNERRLDSKDVPLLRKRQLKIIEEKIVENYSKLEILWNSEALERDTGRSQANALIHAGFYRAENSVASSCQGNSYKANTFRNN